MSATAILPTPTATVVLPTWRRTRTSLDGLLASWRAARLEVAVAAASVGAVAAAVLS